MYGQPPPPGYGTYGQPPPPAYYPPPQQQGPTVITIANNGGDDGTPCQFCGKNTDHITRRTVGCTAIAWGCCLFYFTGILCCLPCFMDGCKDIELVCIKCQNVKSEIPASCC